MTERDALAALLTECGRHPWTARQMADHLIQHGVTLAAAPAPALDVEAAARNVLHLCDCPPDWLMQDGSHHRECLQSQKAMVALRAVLLAATPAPALDVEALYRALLAVENHGAPVVPTDYLAIAAEYARIVNEEAR